jgi:hypothetical protein
MNDDFMNELNDRMAITSESSRKRRDEFDEELRKIDRDRAKRQADEKAKFDRKMLVRKCVRYTMMAGAVVCIVKAVQNAQEKNDEE